MIDMEEMWKDIDGYEGLYQVSNFGRVKSLERTIIRRDGKKYTVKEKILKAEITNGYLRVCLFKENKGKHIFVHRLVATHFIPNTEGKSDVHHKDHNKLNNNVDNLVWLTHEEHAAEHPERFEACGQAVRKARSRRINQFTIDGLFIRTWYSARDIERELDYANQNIISCCKGKLNQAYGYIWKYADQD